jgi:UDP-glucose 4-epimerase
LQSYPGFEPSKPTSLDPGRRRLWPVLMRYKESMAPRGTVQRRLTVAITGPSGEIGQAVVGALERSREVGRILGMARRPFDPSARGWKKVSYRRGDVLDRDAVTALVEEADVVVHLAFMIMGGAKESRAVNLVGSRNVFEATVSAGAKRLVYASSVAAYGFHRDNPQPLVEEVPARGTAGHYYSAQKAEVEALLADTLAGGATAGYVFRPCIVAGAQAPLLIDSLPYTQISGRLPGPVLALLEGVPILKPVLPDPGTPFQLVHHDDVASAMRAAVLGRGAPGVYNLAGPGQLTVKLLAEELGWYSIPVPELAVDAVAEMVARLGFLPAQAQWIAAFREPVIMSASKARRELGWRPRHDALHTLRETITATRMDRLIR